MPQPFSRTFQARRALLMQMAPRYQQASPAQKTLLLDSFVGWTGYTRKYAIELLNHGEHSQETIQRRRLPQYCPSVQQALFLAWKATHYVCAKRLLPSLPTLVALLEGHGHLQLTEEERRQLLAMSVSTAERYSRTQRKPRLHGLSTTTPGPLCKSQIPVRLFSQWEEDRPGFVEMDLVAHCGEHLGGSFLYTLTLTDLATGWTECIPLLYKSADAVLAALSQARKLFPFPLLGIDTDGGSEFINEELLIYCEREHLTFTRGRPGVKNDQSHVEQKNGAVVREAVGCVRLVGVQAYHQLRKVYRALRLMVNCFQPSLKLQAKIPQGDQVRRVYDVAQTPLQRVLTFGVLSETRQRELSEHVQQIDPLALSEHLDALRHALLRHVHTTAANGEEECLLPLLRFSLAACPSGPLLVPEEEPARPGTLEKLVSRAEILNWPRTTHDPLAGSWEEILTLVQAHPEWTSTQILQEIGRQDPTFVVSAAIGRLIHGLGKIRPHLRATWEEPWPTELIQGGDPEPCPTGSHAPEEAVSASGQHPAQVHPVPVPISDSCRGAGVPGTPNCTTREDAGANQTADTMCAPACSHEAGPLALTTIAQAITAYLQEMRTCGRNPKTLEWHQTSLGALQQYLWRQFALTEVRSLTKASLRAWVADLHTAPSAQTGAARAVNTIAAYARSVRAFCNWLVRQGAVPETPFPPGAVPKAQRRLPQVVEPELFARLLHACQLPDEHGGRTRA